MDDLKEKERKPQLEFIGIQKGWGGLPNQPLFNIHNSTLPDLHPSGSTITETTAKRLGWL